MTLLESTENKTEYEQSSTTGSVTTDSLERFLCDVEKRAYTMALFATNNHADALDILQDAMLKMVERYADKPAEQWQPLFYTVLRNRINDWHRRNGLTRKLFFWQPVSQDGTISDWLENIAGQDGPVQDLERQQLQCQVLSLLHKLPEKQQQCFILRSWEGLSVAQTAQAMGCSEGSVKTHYFRAVTKLRAELGDSHEIRF